MYLLKKKFNSEIYFVTALSIINTGFSAETTYLILKRRIHLYSKLSSNKRVIDLKFKMSRFDFKKSNNSGLLPGCYRAM